MQAQKAEATAAPERADTTQFGGLLMGTILFTLVLIYMAIGAAYGMAWCLKHYKAGKTIPTDIPWGYIATVIVFAAVWPWLIKRLEDFHV